MKSGTLHHIKTKRLKRLLGLPIYQIAGVLESLWQVTGEVAWEHGEIGKYTDEEIADAIEWNGDAEKLVTALVDSGWVDRHDTHRLVIHDWTEHRPKYLKDRLNKRNMRDRRKQRTYVDETEDSPRTVSDGRGHGEDTTLYSQPNQTKPNQTQRNQTKPAGGVSTKLVAEDLTNDARLMSVYQDLVDGGLPDSESNRLNVFAIAERAIELSHSRDGPCGMFVSLIKKQQWDFITQQQEDRASERIKRYRRSQNGSSAAASLATAFRSDIPTSPP